MGTRKILIGVAVGTFFIGSAAMANHYATEAQKYFEKNCAKPRQFGITAFVCDLRERIDSIQLIPGPQGPPGPRGGTGAIGPQGIQGPPGIATVDCVVRQFKPNDEDLEACYNQYPHLQDQDQCSVRVLCEADEIATGGGCYYRPVFLRGDVVEGQEMSLSSGPIADSSGVPMGWECYNKNFSAAPNDAPTAKAICCKKAN